MLQVKRAGHSTLTTPDIGRIVDYFTRIVGLSLVARDKDRAILATKSGLEAIALERGGAGEAPRLSFQIAPAATLTRSPDGWRKPVSRASCATTSRPAFANR